MYSKSEGIVISFKFGQFENSSGVTLENVPKIIILSKFFLLEKLLPKKPPRLLIGMLSIVLGMTKTFSSFVQSSIQ